MPKRVSDLTKEELKPLREIYRLMTEHNNPVTRAVYRRIFVERTQ